jgi:hypothetical protein
MASKQIQKIITESLAIESEDAKEAGALGFMARGLVQATMPHRNTGENYHVRKNGDYQLIMAAGNPEIGLPYGSVPRLMLAWLATEAVKTRERELVLGDSMSGFMRELGLMPTGGRWGSITRLKDQSQRLFSAMITCSYTNKERNTAEQFLIADSRDLWWHKTEPKQAGLFESTVKLSERFYDEITQHPVPVDMRALKLLKRSPMALDIYCWLTYRMSYLKRPTAISWAQLQSQFGAGYATDENGLKNFQRAFTKHLKAVSVVYPEANIESVRGRLILKPSKPHVAKLIK